MSLLALAGPTIAEPLRASIANASIQSRKEWRPPFATRAEWLAFVADTSGGSAAVKAYADLCPTDAHERWVKGRTVAISRIFYRSGGLTIPGLLIEPRKPGGRPVLIFNHGGVGR
jgi:hypothetical protein